MHLRGDLGLVLEGADPQFGVALHAQHMVPMGTVGDFLAACNLGITSLPNMMFVSVNIIMIVIIMASCVIDITGVLLRIAT